MFRTFFFRLNGISENRNGKERAKLNNLTSLYITTRCSLYSETILTIATSKGRIHNLKIHTRKIKMCKSHKLEKKSNYV